MKRILFIISLIAVTLSAVAQNITGKVVDENNAPLEFVNVVLLDSDSTYMSGTVTKEDGSFLFAAPGKNAAFVRLSMISYTSKTFPVPPAGSFGKIAMEPAGVMLGEVVVKADRPVTSIKGNALVTGVENTVLAHAGTANDVLTQVPMVLGRDGNFEVFGKGTPLIYINGRKVEDMTELSQLNSSDIKNVEVITSPGAKYDASVKAVIRIRTRRPQGDGWSGTLRTQNGLRPRFTTNNQANLKFRTGGLEIFGNFGYIGGKFEDRKSNDMVTRTSSILEQCITTDGIGDIHDFYGKAGFSYLLNERHSLGAFYSNGFTNKDDDHRYTSTVSVDGNAHDVIITDGHNKSRNSPRHHVNAYYNGIAGKLGLDFNFDYIWKKARSWYNQHETSASNGNRDVISDATTRTHMLAEKFVLSYPLWKGQIEAGEEFTSSRMSNANHIGLQQIGNAENQVEEKNIAGFLQLSQQLGRFNISAGVRYEHVDFNYIENGLVMADQSKSYDNIFPSLSLQTIIGKVQTALSYNYKTNRPSYNALDGTIDYINPFTLESGNPYLRPEKIHNIELMGAWRQFFAQVTYTSRKDAILNTTRPYSDNGDVKLITKDNFPRFSELEAFVGAQFQTGIWFPKVNIGIIKQWLTIDYDNGCKKLDSPLALVQFQNAIHLPADIWLNIDLQWMSAGNGENAWLSSTSYLNAKIYKAFCNNRFSVTLEANDIFNKNNRDFTFYNRDVTLRQTNLNNNRSFMLTLQYNFNVTRDRYRGTGAGTTEQSRL